MKRSTASRLLLVLITTAAILTVSACGSRTDNTQGGSVNQQQPAPEPVPLTEKKSETIKVYYADEQLTELLEQQTEIQYEDELDKVKNAYKALQKDGKDGEMSLWKHIDLLDVKLEDSAITLNVHLNDLGRFGAPGEQMAIDALQKTLFQFDEVTSLEILVDGEKEESLMGHVELDHPFTKDQ
ncbi:GerMN domain-containing protein [Paenibacillus nasutitermitis]|uniref:GerMN domain-containing protein n=1 Tax=Paenibacillus nasutitermitis TaxID=1652958 RepID=A0A916YWN4_9BACL|nr:GerMN domain-containing protein [Paenibacillus nasutitermitis]GGD64784.1 hypothetical protein GCM10010911_23210 [Paenibacillus nasutitermitis]